jgi:GNAT superfamily N-acetyltransferase
MSLSIRPMTTEDIHLGMRLKGQAGWNQIPADWQRFLALEPEGCFVAEWNGQPAATTTTCTFDSVGWIAMVLVDESFRHRGIATQLVQHALEYLDGHSVRTVRLDATKYGRPVYERIGFVAEHDFVRFQGVATFAHEKSGTTAARTEQLDSLHALDWQATGTNRRRLLGHLIAEHPTTVRVMETNESVAGYMMLRPGANATQIGPAAALTEEAGTSLGDWALGHCADRPVFIDLPVDNRPAIEWAQRRGLAEQRRFTRMVRGRPVEEDVALLWASSGPEKG